MFSVLKGTALSQPQSAPSCTAPVLEEKLQQCSSYRKQLTMTPQSQSLNRGPELTIWTSRCAPLLAMHPLQSDYTSCQHDAMQLTCPLCSACSFYAVQHGSGYVSCRLVHQESREAL